MNFQKRMPRILCGAAFYFALVLVPGTCVPGTWALSPVPSAGQSASTSASRSHSGKLDINRATEAQLSALPGSGPVYAKRIIAGRPYGAKNQLISKGILPQGVYDKIKDLIVAHRVKK